MSIPGICTSNVRFLSLIFFSLQKRMLVWYEMAQLTYTSFRFPIADVLWTFAMALDTYLVVFHRFDTHSLLKLEKYYLSSISLLTFIPALVFLFIRTPERGPLYGSETVCSILTVLELCHLLFAGMYAANLLFLLDMVLHIPRMDDNSNRAVLCAGVVCISRFTDPDELILTSLIFLLGIGSSLESSLCYMH